MKLAPALTFCRPLLRLLLCSIILTVFSASANAEKRVFGKSDEESFAGKVVVIEVGKKDLVNKHAFKFWRRVIERVNEEKARAVVFELDTPGGLAMDTADLIMVQMQKLEVPSYAFVNQQALSAGALVAAGTDGIYMHPVSAIGAAALVNGNGAEIDEVMRAKLESAFDAFVRTVSESKGRNPDVLRAMMFRDEYFNFGKIQVEQGKLLSLTASEAASDFEGKPLLAKGIVKTVDELLQREGLADVEVIRAEPSGMEKFAYWTTAMSAVLILVGIGGAYLEMKTPGFGLGGGISLLSFGLFFFGNYLAGNMAGYGLMVLFIIGVILVIVEFFVLPGTLIPGIVGGVMVLVSLFLSMVDGFAFDDNRIRGWDSENAWNFITGPSLALAAGLIGAVILILLMMRFLPSAPIFNRLVMSRELVKGSGIETATTQSDRLGQKGKTITDLRPAGKGEFDGTVLDITAANGFIASGQDVVIISEDGMRIQVKEAGDAEQADA
ncbi:serine protease [Oceaniferula spumae]|uniref:Serine protease n=1 Tax=Oceaniferula spumae TaxID=2979115 RepID=A0AAT9FG91_9BACT